MPDAVYRVLGLAVRARYQLGFVLAVLHTVYMLAMVQLVRVEPTLSHLGALVSVPLLLGLAAWRMALLPPGVVFRAEGAARFTPEAALLPIPRGCRASARFRVGDGWEWRLLAPCRLRLTPGGQLELRVPPPQVRWQTRVGTRRVGWSAWQWTADGRMPLWGADPVQIQRRVRERAESEQRPRVPLAVTIPRAALLHVAVGWQYVGLRRCPALRLCYRDTAGRKQLGYLALDSRAARAALAARLAAPLIPG
ncbi:MAG: hypothetical protein IRZ14_16420 [Chloroflexi bacterium]|nr:hypothetical protein [Chloroflexota bacterium]